jgi:hypothetical protein
MHRDHISECLHQVSTQKEQHGGGREQVAGDVEFRAARNISLAALFLTPMLGWVF